MCRPTPEGFTQVGVLAEGRPVSRCLIRPKALCVGAATVRVDQLGAVWTFGAG
jgi:hypothetical protein